MKKINKLIITCILSVIFIVPQNVYAQSHETYDIINISNNSYDIKCFVKNIIARDFNDGCYIGQPLKNYLINSSAKINDKTILGDFYWENPDYVIVEGEQTVKLIFKPYWDEKGFKTDEIVTCEVYLYGLEQPKKVTDDPYDDTIGTPKTDAVVESTPLSLTATNVVLDEDTVYDINLLNKDVDATCTWKTSDSKVVKINSKSGLITPVSEGSAKVTCTVKNDNEVQTLTTDVIVGVDENAPVLTESDLELSVGNTFDLNLENTIAQSKVKFTSSDKLTAKVNSKTGNVTALKAGDVDIYCTITTPENKVIVLKCDVEISK
jgi:hypothetical protein